MQIKRSSRSSTSLLRAIRLALAAPLFTVALVAGCAVQPAPEPEEQGDEVSSSEQVAEAAEAIVSCPERTDCSDACDSQGLIWGGRCSDDGGCICRPERPGDGGGPGSGYPHFWYCWNVGGDWECFELN